MPCHTRWRQSPASTRSFTPTAPTRHMQTLIGYIEYVSFGNHSRLLYFWTWGPHRRVEALSNLPTQGTISKRLQLQHQPPCHGEVDGVRSILSQLTPSSKSSTYLEDWRGRRSSTPLVVAKHLLDRALTHALFVSRVRVQSALTTKRAAQSSFDVLSRSCTVQIDTNPFVPSRSVWGKETLRDVPDL